MLSGIQRSVAAVEGRTDQTSLQSLLAIDEIAKAIGAAADVPALVELAVESTRKLLRAQRAELLPIERRAGRPLAVSSPGGAPASEAAGWAAQLVLERGGAVLIPDACDAGKSRIPPQAGGRSVIAVPIFIDGCVEAVLEGLGREDRSSFSDADLEALMRLAPYLSNALKSSRQAQESKNESGRNEAIIERRVDELTAILAKGKREWERTFDAIREPLFWLDGYTIRRANLATSDLAEVPIRQVVGQTCHQLLANSATPCEGCPCRNPGSDAGEVGIRGRRLRVSLFPIDTSSVVVHYRDVTSERRMEQQLFESQRMAAVGQLAGGAAHEINNPLGSLLSNLTTLEAYVSDVQEAFEVFVKLQSLVRDGKGNKALEMLGRQDLVPARMSGALTEIPELMRDSRSGGRRVQEIVNALKALVHEIPATWSREDPWEIIDRAADRAGIPKDQLQYEGREIRVMVAAEPLQLEMALANILKNSRQASEESFPIRVGITLDKNDVVLRIRDEGCGMAPEVKRRAFEPFFTTRGIGGGLGLGLTVAYGVITAHRGSISVESEPGCGTEVLVRLPARR